MNDPKKPPQDATALLTLLKLSGEGEQVFEIRELTAVMTHQLRAPLHLALGSHGEELRQIMQRLPAGQQAPKNLEELLEQSRPSPELLGLAKRFAKTCSTEQGSALPRELALVLYYLTIAAARMRCGVRLSELSNDALVGGLVWCRDQKWLSEPLCSLVNRALTILETDEAADR